MAIKERQIKNTGLLYEAGLMDGDKILAKLDVAGQMHKQYSNIEFKVLKASDKEIIMQVKQGKTAQENLFDKKRLVEIVHETFDPLFPGIKIHAREVIPYEPPVSSVVTPEWIEQKMVKLKIGHKDIINDIGMNKVNLSQYLSGDRPMTPLMKTVFYYYFSYREIKG